MPQVPQGQRQIQARPFQAQQLTTNPGLEAFGGGPGVDKMMGALGKLGENAINLLDSHDELEANKLSAELIKRKNKILYGYQDEGGNKVHGYLATGGKDATVKINEYKDEFKKYSDELSSSLANDRQRAKFLRQAALMDAEIDGIMQKHSANEALRYDEIETENAIKTHQDDAVLNYKAIAVPDPSDPSKTTSKIATSLMIQEKLIRDNAARNGYGPDSDFVKQKVLQAKTMTHKGVIERMLANDEDLYATEYLNAVKSKGEVGGNALPDLERMVEAGSLRGESQRHTDRIFGSSSDMGMALSKAREIQDPKLRDEVTQRIKVRYQEANTVKEDLDNKLFDKFFAHVEEFKGRDKIPLHEFQKLPPNLQQAVDNRIRFLNSGSVQMTKWQVYSDLRMMAATPETRGKFLKMHPMEYRNDLADSEFKELVKLRHDLAKGDKSADMYLDGFRSDQQVVNDTLKGVGIDPDKKPELFSLYSEKVDKKVQKWKTENNKKSIPNDVLKKLVDEELIEGTVPGTGIFGLFKTKKRVFQLKDGEEIEVSLDSIPKDDRANIEKALKKRNMPVTEENIVDLYSKVRLKRK
jgi:TusA-related sulfurtransferase